MKIDHRIIKVLFMEKHEFFFIDKTGKKFSTCRNFFLYVEKLEV